MTHVCCVGVSSGLPLLRWSCVSTGDSVTGLSVCPADCDTHTNCDSCMSASVHCVWSVLLQQVCHPSVCLSVCLLSVCPADCDTHTNCDSCTSASVHCVWSVLLQQVCQPSVSLSVRLSVCSQCVQPTVTLTPTVTRARRLVYTVSGVYNSRRDISPCICVEPTGLL